MGTIPQFHNKCHIGLVILQIDSLHLLILDILVDFEYLYVHAYFLYFYI